MQWHLLFQKKQMWLLGASPCVSGVISFICEWHLLFPEKANVTLGGLQICFWSHICHLWVAFASSRKSKCDSWGLSASVSGLVSVICEWHLLFPEKANVTLVGLYLRVCIIYAISGIPDAWNQPNFQNSGPLVQLEPFLYGICLHLLDLPHLLFRPTPNYLAALDSVRRRMGRSHALLFRT